MKNLLTLIICLSVLFIPEASSGQSITEPSWTIQGNFQITDGDLDWVIIEECAYFQVRSADGEILYTRDGRFSINAEGQLENSEGYLLEPAIEISSDVTGIRLSPYGVVSVHVDSDTELHDIGQLKLARFENPAKLRPLGGLLLEKTSESGEPTISNPGENGMPQVRQNVIEMPCPFVITEKLDDAITGEPYEIPLKSYGRENYYYLWSGKGLPRGLYITDEGILAGVPTKTGLYNVAIKVRVGLVYHTKIFTLNVRQPVEIRTSVLKSGRYNKFYTQQISHKGTTPITWSAEGLPEGIAIDSNTGIISGITSECGTFPVTIKGENSVGVASKDFTLYIRGIAPKFSGKFDAAYLNEAYYSSLYLTKGTDPITWTLDGNLPTGLTFDATTGILHGTPSELGGYGLTVTASNTDGLARKSMMLVVRGKAPKLTPNKLPSATVGEYYECEFTTTGSPTIELSAESLPEGFELDGHTLKGTPTTKGTEKIKLIVTNPVKTIKKTFTLKVNAVKTTSTKSLPEAGKIFMTPRKRITLINLSDDCKIACVLPEISVDKSGLYDLTVELDEAVEAGEKLIWLANSASPSSDDDIAEFYSVDGTEITNVSEDRKIIVSAWFNVNRVYAPLIVVK